MRVRRVVVGCAFLVGCSGGAELGALEGPRAKLAARTLDAGCGGTYATLQDAIDDASDGDTIEVCAGTYPERVTVAGKALTLIGLDGAAATVIDAEALGRALTVTGGADLVVEGLTFTGGSTLGDGGNVQCSASGLELVDVVISDGAAGSGGGLAASGCWGVVRDTTFTGNLATWNGGGASIVGDDLALVDSTFVGNSAESGGGAYLHDDSDIVGCTFDGNAATEYGGGAYVDDGAGEIVGSSFVANTSVDDGAGLYLFEGANLVSDNTFELNDSEDEGGGLRIKLSWDAVVVGNTFANNHASYRGGGAKISHGAIVLTDNTWLENTAYKAGALLLYESDSVLTRERFGFNSAERGGAVEMIAGWDPTVVVDSLFVGNEATKTDGGHLYVEKPGVAVDLVRTTFRDGIADRGGAIFAYDTVLNLSNVKVMKNTAYVAGGGLYLDTVTGELANNLIAVNDSPSGAAVELANGLMPVALYNSFVGLNGSGAAVHVASGVAPDVRYNDFFSNASDFSGMPNLVGVDGNFAAGPMFASPRTGDFTLLPGSPLIDAGDPSVDDIDGSRSDVGVLGGPDAG